MSNEAIYNNSPIYKALSEYSRMAPSRFHTPGHKGSPLSPLYDIFGNSLGLDVTELPSTDSLFDASGPIHEAEVLAAEEFGASNTLFSAGGATLCIQAMLRLVSRNRKKIVCARNVHRCVVNAMCLLGLEPVWVWPRPFENSGLPGRIVPEDVESALKSAGGAAAVFVTSPDYYGVISDIGGISNVCKKYKVSLLVDNSHGSHLFYTGGTLHPLRLGADMCCDSGHKTLPVLTGGAYLQIGSEKFSLRDSKAAMSLFGSTSPSYLIMLSLDIARAWLHENGKQAFESLENRVSDIRRIAREAGFFTPPEASFDPVRVTLDFASVGVNGNAAAGMMAKAGISPEMSDGRHVVLLPSPFNYDEDFLKLEHFLKNFRSDHCAPFKNSEIEKPVRSLSLCEAFSLPCQTVPVELSAHRTAAETRCPCPPGVPLVMPGEMISAHMADCLKKYGVLKINVIK